MLCARCSVSCSKLSRVTSGKNCFGVDSRDIGQRRVPDPPERMRGTNAGSFFGFILEIPTAEERGSRKITVRRDDLWRVRSQKPRRV